MESMGCSIKVNVQLASHLEKNKISFLLHTNQFYIKDSNLKSKLWEKNIKNFFYSLRLKKPSLVKTPMPEGIKKGKNKTKQKITQIKLTYKQ